MQANIMAYRIDIAVGPPLNGGGNGCIRCVAGGEVHARGLGVTRDLPLGRACTGHSQGGSCGECVTTGVEGHGLGAAVGKVGL